jgi:hypothetical protein
VRNVYESITYEELKSLPRDQKIEALKELKALYPTQKKIAEKLGVNPANIYNMIAKYVKDEDDGQLKTDLKTAGKAARQAKRKPAAGIEAKNIAADAGNEAGIGSAEGIEAKAIAAVAAGNETEAGNTDGAGSTASAAEKKIQAGPVSSRSAETLVRRARGKKAKMDENLLITLSKSLTGEEAQILFSGISSIFLKNHNYRLEIRISEG